MIPVALHGWGEPPLVRAEQGIKARQQWEHLVWVCITWCKVVKRLLKLVWGGLMVLKDQLGRLGFNLVSFSSFPFTFWYRLRG